MGRKGSGAGRAPSTKAAVPKAAAAQPAIVKPTPPSLFVLHGAFNAEMRPEAMTGDPTPNDRFFVRSHGPTPLLDARTWQLLVEGSGVERPCRLTYDDLLAMPGRKVTRTIECAGDGRAFYEELLGRKTPGEPWRLGAWGVAEWTGVPLSEILIRAGLKRTAVDVMPIGLDGARIRRPMPLAKAMEDDTLLAYRMNGATLPPDHGFPARVIVPGWAGIANVKWVGTLVVSETPLFVKWNTEEYVLIGPDYPPEPPARGHVITTGTVKSAVSLPWPAVLAPGPQTLRGYAWSPFGKIASVDVSLDRGRTFRAARVAGPNIERAAACWELDVDLSPGEGTITPAATDDQGNGQPEPASQPWNEKGYLFGAMVPHPIRVVRPPVAPHVPAR